MTFHHLFRPFRLGPVTLRNRIVSTPHATRFGKDGYNTEGSTKEPLLERLYQRDVAMIVDSALVAIDSDGAGRLRVRGANEYSGRAVRLDGVDTVVLAYGAQAVDGLFAALTGRVPEVVLVGDAMAPRLLHDALLEGTRAARRL